MNTQCSSISLTYYGHSVGVALVDQDLRDRIPPTISWGIEIPKSLRRRYPGRPDIIYAMLVEDSELLNRCHPFAQISGLVVRLSHVALRPESCQLLHELSQPHSKESAYVTLRQTLSTVYRVIFVNRSRVDCRSSNLREVFPPEDGQESVLESHPNSPPPQPPFDLKEFFNEV